MKILILGSSGYIASHLIPRLKKHSVHLADKKELIDISEPDFYDRYKRYKPDLIYHLAADTDVQESFRNPRQYIIDNVIGTAEILKFKCKVIYTSSCGVYGENIIPTPETACPNPRNPYTITKLAAEYLIKTAGIKYIILRLGNVYGGDGERGVRGSLLSGKRINGDGTHTRDYIHVEDVVEALIQAKNWNNGIYNIGTGKETSVNDLADILKVKKKYSKNVKEIARSCLDVSKVLKTGWKPIKQLDE
jgi:UDP-glucose 4-epimerase